MGKPGRVGSFRICITINIDEEATRTMDAAPLAGPSAMSETFVGSRTVQVTTSWDDGHVLDHCVAGLLDTYGIAGTFYVAPRNVELARRVRMGRRDLRALAADFEIGGHTLNHLRLTTIPDAVAEREIGDGKDELEQLLGVPLRSFCYPGGAYDRRHKSMVRSAGFEYARTIRRYETRSSCAMEVHTTVHAYRHLCDLPDMLRLSKGSPRRTAHYFWNWDILAMALFDQVLATGGVYHLWGHSWEIDQNRDWERLERVLGYIARRPGVRYVTNSETAPPAGNRLDGRTPPPEPPGRAGAAS
ncbi:MAG: polysaccharide deacetylase family protein [Pseudonocardia sp.]